MALSDDDKKEIAIIIRTELNREPDHGCRCGISGDTQKKMSAFVGHFMGMTEDIGDGNISKGIESMRSGLAFFKKVRDTGERIGGAVSVFIVISVVTGLITILGYGIKAVLRGTGNINP